MKYCPNCKKVNKEKANFCKYCGANLTEDKVSALFTPKRQGAKIARNIIIGVGLVFLILILIGVFSSSNTTTNTPTVTPQESTAQGEEFTSVEHGFKINFPNYPTTERIDPETDSNGTTYSGTRYYTSTANDKDIYIADTYDYSIAPHEYDNKTGLEGILNALSKTKDYTIQNSTFSKFQGYDAIEFNGTYSNDTYYIRGISFIRDDLGTIKAFLVLILTKDGNNYESIYKDFINSFTLTQ